MACHSMPLYILMPLIKWHLSMPEHEQNYCAFAHRVASYLLQNLQDALQDANTAAAAMKVCCASDCNMLRD